MGTALTLWITIVSLFFGILVGLLIALLQVSKNRYLNVFAVARYEARQHELLDDQPRLVHDGSDCRGPAGGRL